MSVAQLDEASQTLDGVLRAAHEGILLCDDRGKIEVFNPGAELVFGHLAEDVVGRPFTSLLAASNGDFDLLAWPILTDEPNGGYLVRDAQAQRGGDTAIPIRLWVHHLQTGGRRRLLILAKDLTEDEQQETQAAYLRQYDVLTGLLNRREFERRLEIMLIEGAKRDTMHALCVIDVDRLKLVNNTYGHGAGDKLLQELALLFQGKLGRSWILGRIGGDEFAALALDQTDTEIKRSCKDLLQTVRGFPFTWRDTTLDVAVSIGLSLFKPEDESASTALSKADIACHVAKHKGRDRLHVYNYGDADVIRQHGDMRLVAVIAQALKDGRFCLLAQPIRALRNRAQGAPHYEILVRMIDEAGHVVIPDRFIPAAERFILMPAIDRWVISHLFSTQARNLRRWHKQHPGRFLFAINLSGTSVNDEGFLRFLKRQFFDWQVPHSTICFEMTETAAIASLEQARDFMQELGRLGCRFALDDFGAGLSSYLYLRELPVSYLKIDGGFVRGIVRNPVNRAIVESMNQIGHALGLRTIAEWAEDEVLIETLRQIGVDYGQGFGLGAPFPLEDFELPGSSPGVSASCTNKRCAVLE